MDSTTTVKVELHDAAPPPPPQPASKLPPVIDLSSSSSSDSDSDDDDGDHRREKRLRTSTASGKDLLPVGFLDPLPLTLLPPSPRSSKSCFAASRRSRLFWKAGDYDGGSVADCSVASVAGMDHVRVHPKFLHSNATSHKWVLGALAELLDNSLDEVCNGASYVNVDMLKNRKDGSRMLLIEDNGGGMDPEKIRKCVSLGYSAKSRIVNTIGQYGNGFKTSTMRLGSDVIVFSRSRRKAGNSPTQSVGMLSYSFLRDTGKEDIVVPMLDYEKRDQDWRKTNVSSSIDWTTNLETIIKWSPYLSEDELLHQFDHMQDQGTRIVIYNLWEDDRGELELDFDADIHDIQIRGVNRDEEKIEMAKKYPNSRHFLTYRHSLRSYASILYLRLPPGFKMVLRGKEIDHHNIINDMMMKQEVTYRPQSSGDGAPKDPNMVAVVTMGFVKDARHHIDVQGFNVYYKNRLIKPFWRVWNAAGSDGRGVIGVLEANFVEPAHDKQDFERTIVLSRLETKLVQLQKSYWSTNCHRIGYAPRVKKKNIDAEKGSSPDDEDYTPFSKLKSPKSASAFGSTKNGSHKGGHLEAKGRSSDRSGKARNLSHLQLQKATQDDSEESEDVIEHRPVESYLNGSPGSKVSPLEEVFQREKNLSSLSSSKSGDHLANEAGPTYNDSNWSIENLRKENEQLKERISKMEETMPFRLSGERDRNKSLTEELEMAKKKLQEANKEKEALKKIFAEERSRRDCEEETLRKKLKEASVTIQQLLEKLNSKK